MPKPNTPPSGLAAALGTAKPPAPRPPLWKGPQAEGPLGGVTFSSLAKFLQCRERFRVTMIEGLKPEEGFQKAIEYGQCWHTCEEALAAGLPWEPPLKEYAAGLCRKYPLAQEQVQHWFDVCRTQFPLYVEHWGKHPDVTSRTPLMQEQVFDVRYTLPSARVVRLRGKFDAVDLVGEGKDAGVFLFETKTKGDIDEQATQRQLSFDMQTMLYLTVLYQIRKSGKVS